MDRCALPHARSVPSVTPGAGEGAGGGIAEQTERSSHSNFSTTKSKSRKRNGGLGDTAVMPSS